ncbi:DUF6894 family protein [Ancylobacter sonchi]|uniref:DUF6894 family protein n=1 Tax=Ancylobacter sonchi TaxID=1937790 RepID=UPI0035E3FF23
MPIYSFKWSGEELPTEVDLPDEHAAWSEAVMTLGQMLRELDGSFPTEGELEMEVQSGTGATVGWILVKTGKGRPPRGHQN